MLEMDEKEYLYEIIAAVIGEDAVIKQYKNSFNEKTVEVVETMIDVSLSCNEGMKQLLANLVLGSGFYTKGWLKKAIKQGRKYFKGKELKGYGCLVSVKARWKMEIIGSTI